MSCPLHQDPPGQGSQCFGAKSTFWCLATWKTGNLQPWKCWSFGAMDSTVVSNALEELDGL